MKQSGFYTVVLDGDHTIAQYDSMFDVWAGIGTDRPFLESDFDSIGALIATKEGQALQDMPPAKRYRLLNRQRIRERDRKYRELNRDRLRDYNREYAKEYRKRNKS